MEIDRSYLKELNKDASILKIFLSSRFKMFTSALGVSLA